jgi:hypothetical protein
MRSLGCLGCLGDDDGSGDSSYFGGDLTGGGQLTDLPLPTISSPYITNPTDLTDSQLYNLSNIANQQAGSVPTGNNVVCPDGTVLAGGAGTCPNGASPAGTTGLSQAAMTSLISGGMSIAKILALEQAPAGSTINATTGTATNYGTAISSALSGSIAGIPVSMWLILGVGLVVAMMAEKH